MRTPPPKAQRAFTLIELLIVIAIVAILAAIAYPQYIDQARKARRADAKQALLDLAARQERFSTVNNRWATTAAELGYSGSFPLDIQSQGGTSYSLRLSVNNSLGNYTATAAPQGTQQGDPCGDFVLDHQGVQTNTGTASNCW